MAAIRTWSFHADLVGPHAFEDACPFTLYLSFMIELVEYVPLAFLSAFVQTLYLCHFGKYTFNAILNYFFNLMIIMLYG